jgi:hypothetical protein
MRIFRVNLPWDFAINLERGRSFSVIPIRPVRSEFGPIDVSEFMAGVVRSWLSELLDKTGSSSPEVRGYVGRFEEKLRKDLLEKEIVSNRRKSVETPHHAMSSNVA